MPEQRAAMLIVLKYGGNAMTPPETPDPLLDEVAQQVRAGNRVVLVHGGGPQIDDGLAERRAARGRPEVEAEERVAGLRVTDAATLEVTERVLTGTVNKALVRALLRRGIEAAGISGEDGGILIGRPIAPIDGKSLGFVGEISNVRTQLLTALLDAGFTPVVAPLAVSTDAVTALNVNGDTAAGAIAGGLGADLYVVITNVDRVRLRVDDPSSGLDRLDAAQVRAYLHDGTFDGGMAPKMESVLDALARGAKRAIVCGAGSDALAGAIAGRGTIVTLNP
jgi:acetylglutamate kinase